ncbi:MAG TPA: hypothetical protein VII82_14235 [Polyangiaceae bacterium]
MARASAVRLASERSHAEAEAAHTRALHESSARPSDDAALDALTRAASKVQREHASSAAAVAAHAEAAKRASAFDDGLRDAERALECARVQAALGRPERIDDLVHAGSVIVAAIVAVRSAVASARDLLTADHELVRRARALGVAAHPADGLPIAAGIAKALVDVGGDLRFVENEIRWNAPTIPTDGPVPSLDDSAAKIVRVVLAVLGRPKLAGAALNAEIEGWKGHVSALARADAHRPQPPQPVKDNWLQSKPDLAQPTRALHAPSTQWSGDLDHGDIPDREARRP